MKPRGRAAKGRFVTTSDIQAVVAEVASTKPEGFGAKDVVKRLSGYGVQSSKLSYSGGARGLRNRVNTAMWWMAHENKLAKHGRGVYSLPSAS
jgi:hypothetical protein